MVVQSQQPCRSARAVENKGTINLLILQVVMYNCDKATSKKQVREMWKAEKDENENVKLSHIYEGNSFTHNFTFDLFSIFSLFHFWWNKEDTYNDE
jgi:hypothetical protein